MKTLEEIHNGIYESLIKNIGVGRTAYFENLLKSWGASLENGYGPNDSCYTEQNGKIIIHSTMYVENENDTVEIPDWVEFDKDCNVEFEYCPKLLKADYIPNLRIDFNKMRDAYLDITADEVNFVNFTGKSYFLPGIKQADKVWICQFLYKATSCGEIHCNKLTWDRDNSWTKAFLEEFRKNVHYKKISILDRSFRLNVVTNIDSNSSPEDILTYLDISIKSGSVDIMGEPLNVGDFVYFGRKSTSYDPARLQFGIVHKVSGEKLSIKTTVPLSGQHSETNSISVVPTVCSNCIKIDKDQFIKNAKFNL